MALLPVGPDAFSLEIVDDPPSHLLFKIESFSKLLKHNKSMAFAAGNTKWRLTLYPSTDSTDRLLLYLSLAELDTLPAGVNATCSIFLYNHTLDNYLCFRGRNQQFNQYNWKWGFSISKKMLTESNGYLVDDGCIFGAEVLASNPIMQSIQCWSFLEWEIPHSCRSEGVWKSEEFLLGGLHWKMKVTGGERVVICLECREQYERVEAEICICIAKKSSAAAARSSATASHCFTYGKDACAIVCPKEFGDVFKPSKDGCFLVTEITVKGVRLSNLFD